MADLIITATLENLDQVISFVNDQLGDACGPELTAQIDVVVEELYVNIAHYAYHPEEGTATIHCEVGGDPLQITIGFEDRGKPYNPLERQDPDINLSVEEREIGGLGIFMVKHMVDALRYEFRDGKNILTVQKQMERR